MAVKTCATTSQHLIIPRSCKSTWSTHDRTETATAIRDSIFNSFLVLWILIKIVSGLYKGWLRARHPKRLPPKPSRERAPPRVNTSAQASSSESFVCHPTLHRSASQKRSPQVYHWHHIGAGQQQQAISLNQRHRLRQRHRCQGRRQPELRSTRCWD